MSDVAPLPPRPSRDLATLHDVMQVSSAAADEAVFPIARATRLQWAVIGVVSVGMGTFLAWSFIQLVDIKSAQAQTQEQTKAADKEHDAFRAADLAMSQRLFVVERSTAITETMVRMLVINAGLKVPEKPRPDGGP